MSIDAGQHTWAMHLARSRGDSGNARHEHRRLPPALSGKLLP